MVSLLLFGLLYPFVPREAFRTFMAPSETAGMQDAMLDSLWGNLPDSAWQNPSNDTLVKDSNVFTFDYTPRTDFSALSRFFNALCALDRGERRRVRIGYFGDSMTDGDIITQDLRALFQERFGGAGVGFVSTYSASASSRGTVRHSYAPNWGKVTLLDKAWKPYLPGFNGSVAYRKDTTESAPWVKWVATGYRPGTGRLYAPTLWLGKGKTDSVLLRIEADGAVEEKYVISASSYTSLSLGLQNPKQLTVSMLTDSVPFYGASFETSSGIFLDNHSLRGNSGLPFARLSLQQTATYQNQRPYDLLVLHYGANIIREGVINYDWYTDYMVKSINHAKRCFPGADILVASVTDKGMYDEESETVVPDPVIQYVKEAQYMATCLTDVAFVDMQELMGGPGTVIAWADSSQPLANPDYLHLNGKGGGVLAQYLFNRLLEDFDKRTLCSVNDSI